MEGLYYLCSENKGTDQLHSYCAADLSLCLRICKKPVFSQQGLIQIQRLILNFRREFLNVGEQGKIFSCQHLSQFVAIIVGEHTPCKLSFVYTSQVT